jgi:uncharacterized phage protein (predicted DNA packaging)
MVVTLEQVKAQLNQTLDVDDDLISRKAAAAQNYLESQLGFKIDETTYPDTEDASFPDTVPAALVEAICQLAAHWYENREATLIGVNAQELPFGVQQIIRDYRNWSWMDDV